MQVSCLGLARLRGPNEQYALIVDTDRLRRTGERILTPIGGHLHATPSGLSYLKVMGANTFVDDFRTLQFRIVSKGLPAIEAWLHQGVHREASVMPGLRKGLVHETRVLLHNNLDGTQERHDRYSTLDIPASAEGGETRLIVEVFDVSVSPRTLATLQRAAGIPIAKRRVYFATSLEIEKGMTEDGITIDQLSRTIL